MGKVESEAEAIYDKLGRGAQTDVKTIAAAIIAAEKRGREEAAKIAERDVDWSRCFGALMRHLWAWWAGQRAEPETGYSHLWHASCCLAFLIAYEQRGTGDDDRPAALSEDKEQG